MPKLIFVVGSPRSGTSYVARALALADNAACLEDTGLFSHLGARSDIHLFQRLMYPTGVFPYSWIYCKGRGFADRLFRNNRLEHALKNMLQACGNVVETAAAEHNGEPELDPVAESSLQKLSETLSDAEQIFGFGKLAESFFEEFAKRKNCSMVIEKTAEHLRVLPVIHALFPEARVVLVRRDKRQCIASYFKTYGAGTGVYRFIPQRVKEAVLWNRLVRDEGRERWAVEQPWVTAVEFNAVMDHPVEQLTRLSAGVGLTLPREKLTHFLGKTAA
ncbi:sulfotransferase family protein [Pontiella agarivorans]|uniref:Sulfotransferase n=1 Tax=Pontiella agarivorans TaxID=3038953 RepID=A0ABU5MSY5_9BACT|nr:sulfotransferase [Pontiella agarivorans]MDZ8117319.1 sulfotransferase [Pontiella agarivorans]